MSEEKKSELAEYKAYFLRAGLNEETAVLLANRQTIETSFDYWLEDYLEQHPEQNSAEYFTTLGFSQTFQDRHGWLLLTGDQAPIYWALHYAKQ